MSINKNEFITYRPPGKEMASVLGQIQILFHDALLRGREETQFLEEVSLLKPEQDLSEVEAVSLNLVTRVSTLFTIFNEFSQMRESFQHPSLGATSATFEKGVYEYAISYHQPYEKVQFMHIRRKRKEFDSETGSIPTFPDGFEEKVTIASRLGHDMSNLSYFRYFGPMRDEGEIGESFHGLPGLIRNENNFLAYTRTLAIVTDLESSESVFCNVMVEGKKAGR